MPERTRAADHGLSRAEAPPLNFDFGRMRVHGKTPVGIQPKLTIGTPGDAFEQEADRVAAPPIVHDVLRSPGQPLDTATRAFMEPRFGHDFSKVRVHSDARAAEAASVLSARAYTVGDNVVFGPGRYAPATKLGHRLMAHELTHVVQQRAGVHLTKGFGEVGDQYEQQADRVADTVMQDRSAESLLDPMTRGADETVQRGVPFSADAPVQMQHERDLMPRDNTQVAKTREPLQTDKDDLVKKRYFEIVDQGPACYMDAIEYLIGTYGLDASHATMSYDPAIGPGVAAITGGRVGDPAVPIRFGPVCFSKDVPFGTICRSVAHELLHTKQKAVTKIDDHQEREFLAYHESLTRTDLPQTDMTQIAAWITEAITRYNKLSSEKQIEYASLKEEIDKLKKEKNISDPLPKKVLDFPTKKF
jgi:Domain of unknown function (DUF4157)